MASRYWVGGTGLSWDATIGTKWASTSGGVGGASVPTAADDVFFDAASGAVTVSVGAGATAICRSLTFTGFTGTLNQNGTTLQIGDASGGALVCSSTMTWTIGTPATAVVLLNATSTNGGTGWGITAAGKTLPALTFQGVGGKWVLQDALTVESSSSIIVTRGTFDTNNQSVTCGIFNAANANTKTINFGTSTITCASSGVSFTLGGAGIANTTLTATASTVVMTGASATISTGTGSFSYGSFVCSGSGTVTVSGNLACVNFTRTGTAVKTDVLVIGSSTIHGGLQVSGTLTIQGNSAVNRLLVQGSVPGTSYYLGAGTVVAANVDFMDIIAEGAANWNLSAITGGSGNALGNSGITFTTALTLYRVGAGGNWSASNWSLTSGGATGQRVPLPQDTVNVNAGASGNIVSDMPRIGGDVSFSGFAGTWSLTTTPNTLYGSLTLASGQTITQTQGVTFAGRGTHTMTSSGKSFSAGLTFQAVGGTYTLQDALVVASSITVTDGTFTTNNQSVTCTTFGANSTRTHVLNLGTSVLSFTSTGTVNQFSNNSTANTTNGSNATLVVASASSGTNIRTLVIRSSSGGGAIGTVTYTVANSPGPLLLASGGATSIIGTLNVGPGRQLQLSNGQTFQVTNWNVSGSAYGYLYLPGIGANYTSAPDSTPLSITGDIDLRVRVALDKWIPAATQAFIAKDTTSPNRGWVFYVDTAGKLNFAVSGGGTIINVLGTSSVATGVTDGVTAWVRVTRNSTTGQILFSTASGALANPVAADFTQLGTAVTTTAGAMVDNTTPVEIGTSFIGTATLAVGKFYRAQMRSGIDGTVVFDADFTAKRVGVNTFAESSSNAATVTINGAYAQVGDGRVAVASSTPGSTATVSKASGVAEAPYLSVQDSIATGGASWYAPASSNLGNNTGWIFGVAPLTITDGIGATDTPVAQKIMSIALTDLLGETDSRAIAQYLRISDGIGGSEVLTPQLIQTVLTQSKTDPLGSTDNLAVRQGLTLVDAVGITESLSIQMKLGVVVTDSLPQHDGIAAALSLVISDGISVHEQVLPARILNLLLSDSLSASDVTTVARQLGVLISDTLGAHDQTNLERSLRLSITDTAPLNDNRAFRHDVTLRDGATLVDDRQITQGFALTDGATLHDFVSFLATQLHAVPIEIDLESRVMSVKLETSVLDVRHDTRVMSVGFWHRTILPNQEVLS